MDDTAFDEALITAAFNQAALLGWRHVSVATAARDAGLPLACARLRFPGRSALLIRFGRLADQAALAQPVTEPSERERLFDLLMRRFDVLQAHRDGVLALMRALPTDPGAAMLLYGATLVSMRWMLEGAGIPATGLRGNARVHGLLGVWLYALRAWEQDSSPDLSGTMAALDNALTRAAQLAESFGLSRSEPTTTPDTVFDAGGTTAETMPSFPTTGYPTEGFAEDGSSRLSSSSPMVG